jgi:hypothetical protein
MSLTSTLAFAFDPNGFPLPTFKQRIFDRCAALWNERADDFDIFEHITADSKIVSLHVVLPRSRQELLAVIVLADCSVTADQGGHAPGIQTKYYGLPPTYDADLEAEIKAWNDAWIKLAYQLDRLMERSAKPKAPSHSTQTRGTGRRESIRRLRARVASAGPAQAQANQEQNNNGGEQAVEEQRLRAIVEERLRLAQNEKRERERAKAEKWLRMAKEQEKRERDQKNVFRNLRWTRPGWE